MSKDKRNTAIRSFLELLDSHEKEFELKAAQVTDSAMEDVSAAVQELAEGVDSQFCEDENDLDEEKDGALDRLEAIENAKDTLYELSDALAEFGKEAARLRDQFQEIRNSLNESKEA